MGKIENYSGNDQTKFYHTYSLLTHTTSSMAANITFTVSEEAAINELMDDNNDAGEYVLTKEDVDDLSAVQNVLAIDIAVASLNGKV